MDDEDTFDHNRYNYVLEYFKRLNKTFDVNTFWNMHHRYRHNLEQLMESRRNISQTQYWLEFMTDFTNVFLVPCTIIISFLFSLFSVAIFTSSRFKSTFYKYLNANAVIDCVTLMTALLGLFVYTEQFNMTQYVFVYMCFTSLSVSNFIKVALSLDRIFRLKKMAKWYVRKTSFKWIMSALVVIAAGINSPKVIFCNLYTNSWQRSSFMTLTLSIDNKEPVKGYVLVISTILIELIPYISVIVLNIVLLAVVRDHLMNLVKIEEASREEEPPDSPPTIESLRRKRIHFDIYDEDDSDEDTTVDIVVIANMESDSAIEVSSEAKSESGGETIDVKVEKKERVDMRTDIEITRFSLTKMLQMSYIVYILGHSLFVFMMIMIQVKYFFFYGPFMNLLQKNFLWINFFIALSYWFLYISFGANFFVYFAFNGLFRKLISKPKDDSKEKDENGEEVKQDEYSLGF